LEEKLIERMVESAGLSTSTIMVFNAQSQSVSLLGCLLKHVRNMSKEMIAGCRAIG